MKWLLALFQILANPRKVIDMSLQLDAITQSISNLADAIAKAVPEIAAVPQLQADLKAAQDALATARADAAAAQATIDQLQTHIDALTAQLPK